MAKGFLDYGKDDEPKAEGEKPKADESEDEPSAGEMHAMHLFEKAMSFHGDSTMVERFAAFKKLIKACGSE